MDVLVLIPEDSCRILDVTHGSIELLNLVDMRTNSNFIYVMIQWRIPMGALWEIDSLAAVKVGVRGGAPVFRCNPAASGQTAAPTRVSSYNSEQPNSVKES